MLLEAFSANTSFPKRASRHNHSPEAVAVGGTAAGVCVFFASPSLLGSDGSALFLTRSSTAGTGAAGRFNF